MQANQIYNQAKECATGTAQKTVPLQSLRNIKFPFPSITEQGKVVQEIQTRLSVCDQLEQVIEGSLKKAEALRQSILKKAFEGELTREWRERHPELVSGENSAEKLLERIRTEKEKSQPKRVREK